MRGTNVRGREFWFRHSAHPVIASEARTPDGRTCNTKAPGEGSPAQDLAQDRAFWRDLLARRARSRGLPAHSAGGYRNRRFAIIRDAAWITLYRARLPFPQVGVFLRCTGLAGGHPFQGPISKTGISRPWMLIRGGIQASVLLTHRKFSRYYRCLQNPFSTSRRRRSATASHRHRSRHPARPAATRSRRSPRDVRTDAPAVRR